jgi:GNAT superfamily N-acetyltransferase
VSVGAAALALRNSPRRIDRRLPISGSITLRQMADTDVPFADRIRDLAGWNQSLQDWKRLLRHDPHGCFVAEWNGRPAGTATTTSYSKELAWIGMVLVDSDMRRRGIGKALLMQCIEHLRQSGVNCIKLDATPLGKQVYDPLGFVSEWSLSRWQTTELSVCPERIETASDPGSRPLDSRDIGCVADLDAAAFGVARNRMLSILATQSATHVRRDAAGRIVGYGMLRPGARAYYLGPIVAEDESSGIVLADNLLGSIPARPLYWDIPDTNQAAIRVARRYGLHRQRTLTRMYLGENTRPGTRSAQWAIAAPEIG